MARPSFPCAGSSGGSLAQIGEQWAKSVRPALHAKAARLVEHGAELHFREVDDSIREAARIAAGGKQESDAGDGAGELCVWMGADLCQRAHALSTIRGGPPKEN